MSDCLFCRIAKGEIPARKVYEDDEMLAFHDISPVRPVHILLIPKRHITSLATLEKDDAVILGRLLAKTNELAGEAGSTDGFRCIINTGRIGGQEVPHLHLHIIGGDKCVGPLMSE